MTSEVSFDLRPPVRANLTLEAIARHLPGSRRDGDAAISGISLATGSLVAGDLFVAARGMNAHGARYAQAAREAGAVAVLTDPEGASLLPGDLPRVVVDDPRAVIGELSAWMYDYPARALQTIGITGTQGKTSTTFLVDAAMGSRHSGVIGSMGTRIDGMPVPSTLTTPEAPQLHALLALMREHRVQVMSAEVSSHAIAMDRTAGLRFDVGVFLNLGHDHRDFHGSQAAYRAAKRTLLTPAMSQRALVNIDDATGRRFAADDEIDAVTYSVEGRDADWRAEDIEMDTAGSRFTVTGPDGRRQRFSTRLIGAFNVGNAVAAVAALAMTGRPLEDAVAGLAEFTGVEGRVQFVPFDAEFGVVIDAAHKPEAVNALLRALRPLTAGRIITVIGSNGNRDANKRPLMGRFSATASDIVVVTDDNPADEDPALIRRAVLAGTRGSAATVYDVAGRAEGIHHAVSLARAGDMIVIVGKGDERHQITDHGIVPFSDPDEVARALRRRS